MKIKSAVAALAVLVAILIPSSPASASTHRAACHGNYHSLRYRLCELRLHHGVIAPHPFPVPVDRGGVIYPR